MTRTMKGVFTLAVLGVMFQIGHFFEHAFQWGVWLFGERKKPWMSPLADWLCMQAGKIVHPMPFDCGDEKAWMAKQMFFGQEVLHLIGNSIFLVTIALLLIYFSSLSYTWQRYESRKLMKWALAIEGFHLYEHLMLTATVFILDKPIGFSTLFGGTSFFAKENAVGFRVSWHFFMNLIPTILMMKALMPHIKDWLHDTWIDFNEAVKKNPDAYTFTFFH